MPNMCRHTLKFSEKSQNKFHFNEYPLKHFAYFCRIAYHYTPSIKHKNSAKNSQPKLSPVSFCVEHSFGIFTALCSLSFASNILYILSKCHVVTRI